MTWLEQDAILKDLRWLERLALRLVRDPEEAVDLSQEALLAAHASSDLPPESPPERRRRWLSGTLRNLVAKAAQTRGRQTGYERDAARSESLPSPEQVLERAECHQRLLQHVRELPEGYQAPLLLRYYDGATPPEIAEVLQLPVRTVHTRLHRGLKLLRERLDADHPRGREGWMAALFPTAFPSLPATPATAFENQPPTSPASAGSSAPISHAGVIAATAAVACAMALSITASSLIAPDSGKSAPSEMVDKTAAIGAPTLQAPGHAGQSSSRRAIPVEATLAVTSPNNVTVEVIDWDSRPISGASLQVAPLYGLKLPSAAALPLEVIRGSLVTLELRTNARGRVEYTDEIATREGHTPESDGNAAEGQERLFAAQQPGHVTAIAGTWRPSSANAVPFVVVAPSRDLQVPVFDSNGLPMRDLRAWVALDDQIAARFDRPFLHAYPRHWSGSYEGGVLSFTGIPDVAEAVLILEAPGFGFESWPLQDVPAALELGALNPSSMVASGFVMDSAGRPLQALVISPGGTRAPTDASGHFTLRVAPDLAPAVGDAVEAAVDHLWIVAKGLAPLRLELEPAGTDEILHCGLITLERPSASLEGRVLDPEGNPLAGIVVWPENATLISSESSATVLESLAAGGNGTYYHTTSDADGRFQLNGLDGSRPYTLRFLDEATAQWDRLEAAVPGTLHEVRFAAGQALQSIEGRILDDAGQPVSGVSVRIRGPGHAQGASRVFAHGVHATTSADGRFHLAGVPPTGVKLVPRHPDLVPVEIEIEGIQAKKDWTVPRVAQLQVTLQDADRASAISIQRADGTTATLRRPVGLGYSKKDRVPLRYGRTPVLGIGCDARTLLLHRDGDIVDRIPIQPAAGETLRLTL